MRAFGFAAFHNDIVIKFAVIPRRMNPLLLDIAMILRSSFFNRTVGFRVGLMIMRDSSGQQEGSWGPEGGV